MKTVTATDAKNRFRELLEESARGPVRIDRNGRAVAYVVSSQDYEVAKDFLALAHVKRLLAGADQDARRVLKDFASGDITRQAAIKSLGLFNYGQLLKALAMAGFGVPSLPKSRREEMAKAFVKAIRG